MTTAVTTRQEPTKERFSTGKLRPPKADRDDSPPGSPTDMPAGKTRGCFICHGLEKGDVFVSLPDSDGVGRVVHMPINAESGKAVSRNLDCRTTFETNVAAANKRKVQEERETLALAAFRREGGNIPRLEDSPPRGYDCTDGDCNRFFDSENGRDLHLRRGHKVGVGHKAE